MLGSGEERGCVMLAVFAWGWGEKDFGDAFVYYDAEVHECYA